MRYVQLAVLEAPGGCNYTARHSKCPASSLGRDKPATEPMRPDIAVEIAVQLSLLGFRGFYGFHWYSEPMMSLAWVRVVKLGIQERVSDARFVLWTNGSLLTPDKYDIAADFDRVFISNYDGQEWGGLSEKCGDTGCHLDVWERPRLDARMVSLGTPPERRIPCVRPYTEFAVTREGDVVQCCMAWKPEQRLGNVLTDGVEECVRRFQVKRLDAVHPERKLDLDHPCRTCRHPASVRMRWDEAIAQEAEASLKP